MPFIIKTIYSFIVVMVVLGLVHPSKKVEKWTMNTALVLLGVALFAMIWSCP